MSAITNDGSDIINKTISVDSIYNNSLSIENFEIQETSKWINDNNFKKVGLQFPDELLKIAIPISLELKKTVNCQFGIMADTSYGSCCIDEVGGEHFSVDAIVHYGNACLSLTHRKVPSKFVFGKYMVNETEVETSVEIIKFHLNSVFKNEILKKCITVVYDFPYIHFCKSVEDKLKNVDFIVFNSFPNLSEYNYNLSVDEYKLFGSRLVQSNDNNDNENIILFIGDRYNYSTKTILLSMYHLYKTILLYSPKTKEIRDVSNEIQKFLRSRLYSIEVAKSAIRVGLLVGTLSIENYLEIYNYLYDTMRKSGKIVYPMVVGKINANKLANFADLDALVVINCADSCLQFSEKKDDYFKPVVTPYEMICACDSRKFSNPYSSRYFTDFNDLLKEENLVSSFRNPNESELSLISGKLINCSINECRDAIGGELVARLDSDWSVSAIDKSSRSWFGLDPKLGQTPVAILKDGRSGIAAGYENEIN